MACLGGADDGAIDGGGVFAVAVALVRLADGGNVTTGAGCVGNVAEIADLLSAFSGMRGGLFTGARLVGASTLAAASCGAATLTGSAASFTGCDATTAGGVPSVGDAVTFDVAAILCSGFGRGIGSDNSVDAAGVVFAATTGSGDGRATQRPPAMATATAHRPAAMGQRLRSGLSIACKGGASGTVSGCGEKRSETGFGADGACDAGGIVTTRGEGITTVASGSSFAEAD